MRNTRLALANALMIGGVYFVFYIIHYHLMAGIWKWKHSWKASTTPPAWSIKLKCVKMSPRLQENKHPNPLPAFSDYSPFPKITVGSQIVHDSFVWPNLPDESRHLSYLPLEPLQSMWALSPASPRLQPSPLCSQGPAGRDGSFPTPW